MSELSRKPQPQVPEDAPRIVPSIQERKPAPPPSGPSSVRAPARGRAGSAPVLFVENQSLDSLLERAELDLEAGFWPSAKAYADRALALDPGNEQARLILFMAEVKAAGRDKLRLTTRPLEDFPAYRDLMASGSGETRTLLEESNRFICSHLDELYRPQMDQVRYLMEKAVTVPDLAEARPILEQLPSFPASAALRRDFAALEQNLFAPTFARAEDAMRNLEWEEAVRLFESIGGNEKSRLRLIDCRAGLEKELLYRQGVAFQQNNQFREAAEAFAGLEGYRDSGMRFSRCNRMIRGKKVRAVGRRHTQAVWANVFMSLFTSVGCFVSAPCYTPLNLNFLWGLPMAVAALVLTIVKARYRSAKRMWAVMGAVLAVVLIGTLTGLIPFSPAENALPSLFYLLMTAALIFV